jgi:ribosomal protein L31E
MPVELKEITEIFEKLQKETEIRELKKVINRHLKSGEINIEDGKYRKA